MGSLSHIQDMGVVMGSSDTPRAAGVWDEAADHFRSYRAGDHQALDDLVRCLTPVLWHVVRAYGLESERAQDVVQTTWLTFVRRESSISEPQAVAAWLTTTARDGAVERDDHGYVGPDAMRAQTPGKRVRPPGELAVSDLLLPALDGDRRARLWACVQQLSQRCQRLMRIVAFDDKPDYKGLAEEMQMPVGSIGPTRGRCLAKLKALLAGEAREMAHE